MSAIQVAGTNAGVRADLGEGTNVRVRRKLPSVTRENAAFLKLMGTGEARYLPSARRHVSDEFLDEVASNGEVIGVLVPIVCSIYRGRMILPDNLTGPCADCGVRLQFHPEALTMPERVCSPCGLKRYGKRATR